MKAASSRGGAVFVLVPGLMSYVIHIKDNTNLKEKKKTYDYVKHGAQPHYQQITKYFV
jgi:hypothetical protein